MYQKIPSFLQIFVCTLGYFSATGNASHAQVMSQRFTPVLALADRDSLTNFTRLDSKQFLDQVCKTNGETSKSSLIFNGKGGVPAAPDLPLDSRNITTNGQNTNSVFTIPEPLDTSQDKIQPARGIKVTESGRVVLTAYRTINSRERTPQSFANCGV